MGFWSLFGADDKDECLKTHKDKLFDDAGCKALYTDAKCLSTYPTTLFNQDGCITHAKSKGYILPASCPACPTTPATSTDGVVVPVTNSAGMIEGYTVIRNSYNPFVKTKF